MRYKNTQEYYVIDDFIEALVGAILKISEALFTDWKNRDSDYDNFFPTDCYKIIQNQQWQYV